MRIVTHDQIGSEIDRMRQQSNLTIEQFGKKHGFTRVTMSKVINGHTQPSRAMRKKLKIEPVYRIG